jgi:hypothetical protein
MQPKQNTLNKNTLFSIHANSQNCVQQNKEHPKEHEDSYLTYTR